MGVDGCGVLVHGMRLRDMATLFARLARPERMGDLARSAATAAGAMLAEPYLVAGRNRVDTAVMEATGDVAVKAGAEGLQCAAAVGPGLGIAVKSADGGSRDATSPRSAPCPNSTSSPKVRSIRPSPTPSPRSRGNILRAP